MDDLEKENRRKMDATVALMKKKCAETQDILDGMLSKRLADHGPKSAPMTAEQATRLLDES